MAEQSPLATVILAAGKGTRMKSPKAKVLHEVFFQPMVHHVIRAAAPLGPEKAIVIVGHQKEAVEKAIDGFGIICVEQKEQNGTGHAVLCTEETLAGFTGNVMILCGDSPLLRSDHLREMLSLHQSSETVLTIITTTLEDPTNYGRIIADDDGNVLEIVEEKDANREQRQIREINAGIYCAEKEFLFKALKQITTDNSQGEMYLTDIIAIGVKMGHKVQKYEHPDPSHVLGVNSRVELAQAHMEIQARRNRDLMSLGITMHNPPTISVAADSEIGDQCTLTQNITISGTTSIGSGCEIGPNVHIRNATIGTGVRIGANSVLINCTLDDNQSVPSGSIIEK